MFNDEDYVNIRLLDCKYFDKDIDIIHDINLIGYHLEKIKKFKKYANRVDKDGKMIRLILLPDQSWNDVGVINTPLLIQFRCSEAIKVTRYTKTGFYYIYLKTRKNLPLGAEYEYKWPQ